MNTHDVRVREAHAERKYNMDDKASFVAAKAHGEQCKAAKAANGISARDKLGQEVHVEAICKSDGKASRSQL